MQGYVKINNKSKIKFNEELELTNTIDNILFFDQPYKKFIELNKMSDIYLYKLLINKYEFITFEYINKLYNNPKLYKNTNIEINNNIINIANINILPLVKGFNMNKLLNIYSGSLKYFTMVFNPYLNTLKNKKICIIKQINNKLEPYFHEEEYLAKNNKVKTIFIYYDNDKIQNTNNYDDKYKYIILNNLNDKIISEYISDSDVVIIDEIKLLNNYACLNDNIKLVQLMYLVNHYIKSAKEKSDLVFLYDFPHILPQYQLYYYLYTNFNTVVYYKNLLSPLHNGIFIFNFFIKSDIKLLENIINKYSKNDDSFGHNIYLKTNKKWCEQQTYIPKIQYYYIISSLYNNKFDTKFNKFIEVLKINQKKIIKLNIKKINYLKNYIYYNDNTLNIKKIKSIILYNINESVDLLKMYNIELNDIYVKNTIKNPIKILKTFFPNISNNILTNIQFSRDSIYSISSYEIAENISLLIKKIFPNCKNIIDGTANIGENTFNFAKHFNKVISNEFITQYI